MIEWGIDVLYLARHVRACMCGSFPRESGVILGC